jgi:hypothetical protein
MAALTATHPTLLDVAKRKDPSGKIAIVAETLNQVNPILDDMPFVEGNLETGHKSVIRTGLPGVTWRKLYGGVQPSKSRSAPVTDACGMLEAYAEIDKALADLNGNSAAWRASEDKAFIEAMSQEFASTLIYGNSGSEPEAFTGLSPRFNDQSAANGGNILTDAATPDGTDNSSIWLIGWSPETVFGIYPKGSVAGLSMKDLGEVTVENVDGNNGRAQMYRSHYRWDGGLSVKDWRYVVRVQIDEEDLTKNAGSGPDLIDLMSQAIDLLPSTANCRPVFYANRTVRGFLRRQIMNKVASSTLSIEQIQRPNGALIREPMFDGIPVRRCDALLSNESGI